MVSRQAHFQRDYAALGEKSGHAAATDDGHATASGAADQTLDEPPRHSAQGAGTRVETCTITASEPADQPPGTTPSSGQGHLDYARSEGGTRRPNTHAEQAAAQDLDQWIKRIITGEQHPSASDCCLLRDSRNLEEGTPTMEDVAFGHQAEPQAPPTTMDYPGQWHYVSTWLMAHMRTYSPDERNQLHWLWHRRAALRIRTACKGTTSGTSVGPRATRDTPLDTDDRRLKRSRTSQANGTP